MKVPGRSVGPGHLKAHLDYVTRNGTLRAIGGDGRVVETRPELRGLHDEWVLKNKLTTRRHDDKAASAVHIMLSMPPKTTAMPSSTPPRPGPRMCWATGTTTS